VKETSGSSAYVPKEPEKDVQLQYALSFLRGTATDAQTARNAVPPPAAATPGADTKEKAKN
jgi:carboxyl-terminal processing protease